MYPITNSILTNSVTNLEWIVTQSHILTANGMSSSDQEKILGILLRVPLDKVEFLVNETLRLANSNDYNFGILETLSSLSFHSHRDIALLVDQTLSLLNETNNDRSDQGRAIILYILSQLSPPERELFIHQARDLIIMEKSDLDRAAVIGALSKAPLQERELLLYEAGCFLTKEMTSKEKIEFISLLFSRSEETRILLFNQVFSLLTSDMPDHARALLTCALSNVPPQERELFIYETRHLTEDMTGIDKIEFISTLSKMSREERLFLFHEAFRLLGNDLCDHTTALLIRILYKISPYEREFLIDQSLSFLTSDIPSRKRLLLLCTLYQVPMQERELFLHQVRYLISDAMQGDDIIDMISWFSQIPQEQRVCLIHQVHSLLPSTACAQTRAILTIALHKISFPERNLLIDQTLSLINSDISDNNREEFIRTLCILPSEERAFFLNPIFFSLIHDMSPEDKTLILSYLLELSHEERILFVYQLHYLLIEEMSGAEKGRLFHLLYNMPYGERTIFVNQAKSLMPDDMSTKERVTVACNLSRIPYEERSLFIDQIKGLISSDMAGEEKVSVIYNLSEIACEQRIAFIDQVKKLFTPDMSGEDRVSVIYSLSLISEEERRIFIDQVNEVFTPDMLGEDRTSFIYTLSSLSHEVSNEARQIFIDQIQRLITEDMQTNDRVRLIYHLCNLQYEDRNDLVCQAFHIIDANMLGPDRILLIEMLSQLSKERRNFIIEHARSIFTRDMEGKVKIDVIHLLSIARIESIPFIIRQVIMATSGISSMEERSSIIVQEIVRLLEKRFMVTSTEITQNPVKVLVKLWEMLEGLSIQLLPSSIQYIDSIGIDEGGLTRAFVSTITKSFCDSKYSLISNGELNFTGSLATTDSSALSIEDQEKCFKVLGRFFSAALQQYHSLVLGSHFDPVLFEMLIHLSSEDLTNYNSKQVFDKLLKIYLLKKFKVAEELADNLIANHITDELRDIYCIDSKDEFINEHKIDKKIKAVLLVATSMRDSLLDCSRWESLRGNSADVLREKIQGVISRDSVRNALQMDPMDRATQTSWEYLTKWINGSNSEMLEKFIEAISGTKTLTSNATLNIAGRSGLDKLPLFHTCFFRIDLSDYSSYEAFKEKLELSLEYCFSESGFQIG